MPAISETAAVAGSVALIIEMGYVLGSSTMVLMKDVPRETASVPRQDLLLVLIGKAAIYTVTLYGVYFERTTLLGTSLGRALCWCVSVVLITEVLRRYWSPPLRRYHTLSGTIIRTAGAACFSFAAIAAGI